jgi:hypothetical protein
VQEIGHGQHRLPVRPQGRCPGGDERLDGLGQRVGAGVADGAELTAHLVHHAPRGTDRRGQRAQLVGSDDEDTTHAPDGKHAAVCPGGSRPICGQRLGG